MKCKVCGYEFDSNRAYCPMCGSKVPETQKRIADEEMSWNTYDFPKPRVPENIEMHWPSMNPGSSVSVMKKDATEGFIRSERPAQTPSEPSKAPAQPVPEPAPSVLESLFVSSVPETQPMSSNPESQAEPQPVQPEPAPQPAPQSAAAPQPQAAPQPFPQGVWQMPQMQPEPTWTPYNVQAPPQQSAQGPVISPMYVPQYTPPQMAWTLPSQATQQTAPVYLAQPAQQVYIPSQPPYPAVYPAYPQQTQSMAPVPPMQQTQSMAPVPPMQQTQSMASVPPMPQMQPMMPFAPMQPPQPVSPQAEQAPAPQPVQPVSEPQPEIQPVQSEPAPQQAETQTAPELPKSRFVDEEDSADRILKENIVATKPDLPPVSLEPAAEEMPQSEEPEQEAPKPEETRDEMPLPAVEPDEDGRIPERFFTFNKKNEEFQQLLNREYERLRSIHGEDAPRPARHSVPGVAHSITPAQAFFQDDTIEPSDLSEFERMILESTVDGDSEKTIAINRERIKGVSGLMAEDLIEPLVPGIADTIPRGASKESLAQLAAETAAKEAQAAKEEPKEEVPEDPRSEHHRKMEAMRKAREAYFASLLSITGERRTVGDTDIQAERESARKEAEAIAAAAKEDAEAEAARRAAEEEAARQAEIERAAREREEAIARAEAEMKAALEKRRTAEMEAEQEQIQEAGEAEDQPAQQAEEPAETSGERQDARAIDTSQLLTEDEREAEEKKTAEDRTAALTEVLDKADEQNKIREEREKSHWFLKLLLAIIIVLGLAEGGTIALRHFMPGTPMQVITTGIEQNVLDFAKGLFNKDEPPQEEPEEPADSQTEPETPEAHFVFSDTVSAYNKNIESVVENLGIGYDSQRSYDVPGLSSSVLAEESDKEDVCGVLIAYNSSWIDYVNGVDQACLDYLKADGSAYRSAVNFDRVGQIKERFVQLEIGEIRQYGDSFFVFDRETIEVSQEDKSANSISSMVYELVPVGGELKIKDYYTLD